MFSQKNCRIEHKKQDLVSQRYYVKSIFFNHYLLILAQALQEIKYYQSTVTHDSLMLNSMSFARVIREIAQNIKTTVEFEYR
jgi:hypothetical protein